MYKVGYLDDQDDLVQNYIDRVKRYEIELMIAPQGNKVDVMNWIVDNQIKCMIVDYRLNIRYDFNGTELVNFLNDELRGLPCLILTSYRDTSIQENKVIQNMILERSIWDSNTEEFEKFCDNLIQATQVFDENMKRYKQEYKKLLDKKESGKISEEDENTLLHLYHLLKNFGEVDDLPESLLKLEVCNQLDEVLDKLNNLLKNSGGE